MSLEVITKPSVKIDPKLLSEIKSKVQEQGQVILHFLYYTPGYSFGSKIRIWPTSYLYDVHGPHRSEMVHHENITLYPDWQDCPPGSMNYFTLIFSGLPQSCTIFDFVEECDNEGGAFTLRNINRNKTDVYFISIM